MNGFLFPQTTEPIAVLKYHDNDRFNQARVGSQPNKFNANVAKRTNLFVNRVPFNYGENDLRNLFSKFGVIKSLKLKKP
jgi:RNA recognition motif-containing protein